MQGHLQLWGIETQGQDHNRGRMRDAKWLYHTGLLAKSGARGWIIAVPPRKSGIAVISLPWHFPRNRVRAQKEISNISKALGDNAYSSKLQ